jgi:hypothetical protein
MAKPRTFAAMPFHFSWELNMPNGWSQAKELETSKNDRFYYEKICRILLFFLY